MGKANSKEILLDAIKQNKVNQIKDILCKDPTLKNEYLNKNKDHTGLCMAAYFGSLIATKTLLELGHEINQPEKKDGSTPLIIAAKRNEKALVKFLIENGADVNYRNNLNLNALDYSIIHGNYEIAFNFQTNNEKATLKSMDEYIELNRKMNVPCFNIPLFYQNLVDRVEPKNNSSFFLTKEEKKNLEGKIPDLNEPWAHFYKRMLNYKPSQRALSNKNTVQTEKGQTIVLRCQTKLMDFECSSNFNIEDHNIMPDVGFFPDNNPNVIKIMKKEKDSEANKKILYRNKDNLLIDNFMD